ncbi:unnamed protein product [Paramecium sonneborni]|uniref:Uncharacterized protein n=1 Tax=Paramecium sonneborni TaxID=65129 RepID=A0A8S1RLD9_9CILI|nr:unnamed protein product [Paramecium sonneborni]
MNNKMKKLKCQKINILNSFHQMINIMIDQIKLLISLKNPLQYENSSLQSQLLEFTSDNQQLQAKLLTKLQRLTNKEEKQSMIYKWLFKIYKKNLRKK